MSAELPSVESIIETIWITAAISPAASTSTSSQQLIDALSLLFEPSPTLTDEIVPSLVEHILNTDEDHLPYSYTTLIDTAINLVSDFPDDEKARFISAHPRIGEVKGLSALSAAEQGQSTNRPNSSQSQTDAVVTPTPTPTPAPVLERLAHLNAIYERRYPGLVYITFVNGRSRAQIRDELEGKLRDEGVLPDADEPDGLKRIEPYDMDDVAWRNELARAIDAIRDIALSRLEKLGEP